MRARIYEEDAPISPLLLSLLPFLLALVLPIAAWAGELFPAEDAVLSRVHVEFRWPSACDAWGYELAIVPDDGSQTPFAQPGVLSERVRGLEPRTVVTDGIEWGTEYAWRVRSLRGRHAGPWGPVHRFSVRPLPDPLLPFSVSEPEPGPVARGLTIVDFIGFSGQTQLRAMAVDRGGRVIWFNDPAPNSSSIDTRQLANGLISYTDGDRAFAITLDGEVEWASPADPSFRIHHELFPMPNGNFLTVVWDYRDVEIDGEVVQVRGDRIVELDRETNEVVWEWSTFDGYSLEDYPPPPEAFNGNWTHVNAVVYDRRTNSVTLSSRNLSRITRIDYETGEIIFNMGKASPSGDVDFGDGLFRVQHAPEVQRNGNLLIHDNGIQSDPVANKTRAIELQFDDLRNPTSASIVWEYVLPKFSAIIGDADRQPNGNTLITSGFPAGAVYEVTHDGQMVWRLDTVSPFFFYRAERIPALVVRSRQQLFEDWIDVVRDRIMCHVPPGHGPKPDGLPPRAHPHLS